MVSIAKQIDSIKYTNKEIVPLMLSMVKTLDKVVKLILLFLKRKELIELKAFRE